MVDMEHAMYTGHDFNKKKDVFECPKCECPKCECPKCECPQNQVNTSDQEKALYLKPRENPTNLFDNENYEGDEGDDDIKKLVFRLRGNSEDVDNERNERNTMSDPDPIEALRTENEKLRKKLSKLTIKKSKKPKSNKKKKASKPKKGKQNKKTKKKQKKTEALFQTMFP